ncbi:MAG: hypothetical protein IJ703_05140 [Eubacterium sp.]|nr:hypothetical protein [Eubacterium sp.]
MKTRKKILAVIMTCFILVTVLVGCGKSDGGNSRVKQGNAVDDAINDQINKEKGTDTEASTEATTEKPAEIVTTTESTTEATTEVTTGNSTADTTADQTTIEQVTTAEIPTLDVDPSTLDYSDVDIDITVMSSDMVYATVYQMVYNPRDYIGKTVKIRGNYYVAYSNNPENDNFYNYCLVADATACCQQGLEFLCFDGHDTYPDDFPADGTEVEVTGVFEMYEEEGYTYMRLTYADMTVCN